VVKETGYLPENNGDLQHDMVSRIQQKVKMNQTAVESSLQFNIRHQAPRGQSMDANRARLTPLRSIEKASTIGGQWKAASFNNRALGHNFEVRGSVVLK